MTNKRRLTITLAVLGGLSLTGLPALAATAVWSLIFALQQGG